LSCLGHADAWPAGDLALQEAARVAFALPSRPSAKDMQALADPWRPWRAVAARVLWTYYRAAAAAAKSSPAGPAPVNSAVAKAKNQKRRLIAPPKTRGSAGGNRRKIRSGRAPAGER
jgi:hypothetical protein